jgi:Methyltransferase domain
VTWCSIFAAVPERRRSLPRAPSARQGHVLGADVAGPLLAMARAKVAREDLANIEFRQGDATHTGLADGSFDAVVCVFAVFFARYGGVRRGDVAAGPRRRGTLTRGTAPANLTG